MRGREDPPPAFREAQYPAVVGLKLKALVEIRFALVLGERRQQLRSRARVRVRVRVRVG